ncbi:hypothetical protein PAAL109150_18670 [Paenibacillus alkaliterrae]
MSNVENADNRVPVSVSGFGSTVLIRFAAKAS